MIKKLFTLKNTTKREFLEQNEKIQMAVPMNVNQSENFILTRLVVSADSI